jgi:hypothetical protein
MADNSDHPVLNWSPTSLVYCVARADVEAGSTRAFFQPVRNDTNRLPQRGHLPLKSGATRWLHAKHSTSMRFSGFLAGAPVYQRGRLRLIG